MKNLWNKLAKLNSKFYTYNCGGKDISDDNYRESGASDYIDHLVGDKFVYGSMLEIGCGNGRMTEFIAQDWDVIGIDISGEMIRQAQERLPFLRFIETDGHTIPLPDNMFNVVFSYLVFQHFKSKKMVEDNFKEAYRVLKPEGLLKVRVRTDKVDLDSWWGGVDADEKFALSIGFKLLKKEPVGDYGLWLWLQK